MYLFANNKNRIEVYEVKQIKSEIRAYREKVLEKYKDQPIFYDYHTNWSKAIFSFQDSHNIDIRALVFSRPAPRDHEFYGKFVPSNPKTCKEKARQKELLEKYLNGEYKEVLPFIVNRYNPEKESYDDIYYFIETTPYGRVPKEWYYSNLLCLPKELYLLQLLEQEYTLSVPHDEDYSEILKNYEKKKIGSASLTKLKLLIDTDIIRQSNNSIYERMSCDEQFLRQIKHRAK